MGSDYGVILVFDGSVGGVGGKKDISVLHVSVQGKHADRLYSCD